MKKFLVILMLVLLVSAFAVPAALAHRSGPVGNTTTVTAGGSTTTAWSWSMARAT